jgi:1,2-diacylglycerol 3-beta-galactosyltransferase
VVPTKEAYKQALEYGFSPERVQIIGIPVDPALIGETDERDILRSELGWQADLTTILVVGSSRVRDLNEMLRGLNHSSLRLQLVLVAGDSDELKREFQETDWHIPTHHYGYVDNMPELMRASDCIVCKAGGLIVTEALSCGLPLVLVDVLPGQERGNADYVVEHGAGALTDSPITVLETVFHWLEHEGALLSERARNSKRLGNPKAAYEIAELIWKTNEITT